MFLLFSLSVLKLNHYVYSPSKFKNWVYLLCFSCTLKQPCLVFIFVNHCLFIKESFSSRYVLYTVSFLRTWMLGISLFSTYAFKRLGKVLRAIQGDCLILFFHSVLYLTNMMLISYSFLLCDLCFLSGRLSLIFFLKTP